MLILKTVITTFDALAILTFFLLGRDNSNEKDAVAVWGSLIALFLVNIFGICFLPEILTTVGRIHISRKKHTGETDVLDLDSDAEHQSEKSEHPV